MNVIQKVHEMQTLAQRWRRQGRSIGFVPTMGALHEGHDALVRRARAENDFVVASIFVNPLQFGPKEDYRSYPRRARQDRQRLQKAKTDVLFAPTASEMYRDGFA